MAETGLRNVYLNTTAAQAQRAMTLALTEAGIENASTDARSLVPAALRLSKQQALMMPSRPVSPAEADCLAGFTIRRSKHEPVSRILGQRAFYGRTFEITQATLDPRPDSETLIGAALELVAARDTGRGPLRIVDIGTGSGCLLLTLLAELPDATGTGTDISRDALAVAERNAHALGLSSRAAWQEAKSLDGVTQPFDLLISNPPYIASRELEALPPDVRLYDPLSALDGGPDGLEIYREILAGLAVNPTYQTALFEVGARQANDLISLAAATLREQIRSIRTWQDLGGHRRCVAVQTHY